MMSFSGCAPVTASREEAEIRESLQHAQRLLARGDYDGSLRESQRVLTLARDEPRAAEAIFNMGLVFVHPGNAKRDNRKAIELFNRVTKEYPESPLAQQAKIWAAVLDGVEKAKQVDLEIEEKKRERAK